MGHHGDTTILTARESQVTELIAWGASQKEVANNLGISRFTVDNTLRKIYQKLHINKINELSAWWFCTTFGISFDLSPIKRTIVTCCLLGIFVVGEFYNDSKFCRYRVRRSARTEYRIKMQ